MQLVADDIGDHLARVLASDRFARSKRNSELLAYLVGEVREGRADAISGTSVAQDVFGKGAEFDPATDPSIRVQMGRLRKMLNDYYAEEGQCDDVRIVLPKASYVPKIVPRSEIERAVDIEGSERDDEAPPPPARRDPFAAIRNHPYVAAMVAAAFVILAVVAVIRPGDSAYALPSEPIRDYPVIHVQPFSNRTGDAANDVLERGMQRQVAADLERFNVARIALGGAPVAEGETTERPDFTLAGTVVSTEPTLDMIVQLIATDDSAVVASERLTVEGADDYLDALEELSSRISSDFGGPRGRLATTMLARFSPSGPGDGTLEDANLAAFRCLASFHAFETDRSVEQHGAVRDCLAHHSGRNPNDGTLLSALAWTLLLGSAEAGLLDTTNLHPPHDPAYALELAERAVAGDPGNDDAHEYLGLIEWFSGYHERALASLRRALTLNPANARHRANYGLFSVLSGDRDRGVGLMEDAIEWDLDPPDWYRSAFFYDALMEGDGERALAVLDSGSATGDPFEPVYRLAAASIAERADEVARLLPIVRAHAAERDGDPLDGVRTWLADTEALAIVARELEANGIPVPDAPGRTSGIATPTEPKRGSVT